ncbi:hypothetical protein PF005_g22550 [Phytophthora fragariae]|uniref:Uncharacterized protein n=1 Tax=Phytophthora fragariae TaxID=53985 RepID=A0A6A3QUI0_9STRA|nr:hypothetical protein PF007_g21767 [Phytophthora fragariae]KAE9182285.1 hypothetical protein PF005_g22550 [Phytophthora fragariae]
MAPTVDVVKNGAVRVVALNVEGKREKLPAREALGSWIPIDETMQMLALNGELERERIAAWISTLKQENAPPLKG